MHVLIATSSYPLRPDDAFAAAGLFVRDFALTLARRGHRVTVLTHARAGAVADDPEIAVLRHAAPGIGRALARLRPWHPLDLWRAGRLVGSGRGAARAIAAAARVDHVLAMWAFPAGVYARDLKRSRGVPYSVWALGSDIWTLARLPLMRGWVRAILREADHRFADGLALGRATAELGDRPCEFLPSARLPYEGPLPPVEWPRPGFQFVFIGRLEMNKGPDVLVRAAALLRDRGREFAVTMFGDGTLRPQVEGLVRAHRLDGRVTLRGFAPPAMARAYLEACDTAVIPSRIESIPVIFSDALRAGAPLVVTDVGDLGALVRENGIGAVAPPDDPAGLAAAMEAAIDGDRRGWRERAVRLALRFSVDGAVSVFLASAGRRAAA